MSIFQTILILVTVALLSVGQVLFKLAAMEIASLGSGSLVGLLNQKLIIALLVYALATGMWVLALTRTPLSLAYPFVALAFIIVPVLSYWWIGEPIKLNTIVGAAIIFLGILVSVVNVNY
jgi:drug/metabolite transporter (DMT)-like permease